MSGDPTGHHCQHKGTKSKSNMLEVRKFIMKIDDYQRILRHNQYGQYVVQIQILLMDNEIRHPLKKTQEWFQTKQ